MKKKEQRKVDEEFLKLVIVETRPLSDIHLRFLAHCADGFLKQVKHFEQESERSLPRRTTGTFEYYGKNK